MTFRDDLEALSLQFVTDYQRSDARACASAYTNDAVIYLNGETSVRGGAAIVAHFDQAMKDSFKVGRLTTVNAESNQDFGYAIQTFQSNAGMETVMLALRRSPKDGWKVCAEVIVAK